MSHRLGIALLFVALLVIVASGLAPERLVVAETNSGTTTRVSADGLFAPNLPSEARAIPQQPPPRQADGRNDPPPNSKNVELAGHFGGTMGPVAIDGRYAYVGQGPRVAILDLADPTVPVEVGRTPLLPARVGGIVVANGYAYVTVSCCLLLVIDVTNPAAPVIVGSLETLGIADLALAGDNLFLAVSGAGLQIVNIADPAHPVEIDRHDTPGTATGIALNGTHAYIADTDGGVRVIDVIDPANPQEIGFYTSPSGDNIRTVAADQDHVFAGGDYAFYVLDVSDPATPTEVTVSHTIPHVGNMTLTEDGTHLVVAAQPSGVSMVDITDPAHPFEAGSWDTQESAIDVALAGHYAFATIFSDTYSGCRDGLAVLDVAAPAAPAEVGFFDTVGNVEHVTVVGDTAYLSLGQGGLRIMDVTDPAEPQEIAAYDTPGSAGRVFVDGDTLYVADGYDGMLILDVTDPAAPQFISAYDTFGIVVDIVIVDGIAYVADDFNGLLIIDVSDPAQPAEIGQWGGGSRYAFSLTTTGGYAYVHSGVPDTIGPIVHSGFSIIDVTDPAEPKELYSRFFRYDDDRYFSDVVMVRNYAYLLGGSQIHLLDVTNPALPVDLPSVELAQPIYEGTVAGEFLYGFGEERLQILNVTAPLNPFPAGFYVLPQWTRANVTVGGEFVYLALEWDGAMILRFTPAVARSYVPVAPSSASGHLAFVSVRDGNEEIYLMQGDGANVRRLTDNPARDWAPAWSDDGNWLVFNSDRDGDEELYLMQADGRNIRQLTDNDAFDCCADWSPDGRTIVFNSNQLAGDQDIYVLNVNGTGLTNLTNSPGDDWAPAWSPDGTTIAFDSRRDGQAEVYMMNADGSNQRRLTNLPSAQGGVEWSPDGLWLLYHSTQDGPAGHIYRMAADGSDPAPLTTGASDNRWPDWRFDGREIAFTSNRDGNEEIYVMRPDGSNVRRITDSPGPDTGAAWQPQH